MLGQDGHVLSVSDKMEIYLKERGLRTHARRDDDAQNFGGIAAIVQQAKSMESVGILQQIATVFNTLVLTHAQMAAMKAVLRTQLCTPKAILTEKEFYEWCGDLGMLMMRDPFGRKVLSAALLETSNNEDILMLQ